MFQTIPDFLNVLFIFFKAGIVFAVFCDVVRFLRISFSLGKTAVFISDVFVLITAAPYVMLLSVEYGYGMLRGYYLLAIIFGMTVYFFTVGYVTGFIAKVSGKIILKIKKLLKKLIYNPIVTLFSSIQQKFSDKFEHLRQKNINSTENLHFGLKKPSTMMYNSRIGKLCANGGGERNVIKAKVRKKT